jgi:hypothetical protein
MASLIWRAARQSGSVMGMSERSVPGGIRPAFARRGGSGSARPRRVVVIDRCDGAQVGRDSVQYSVYRVSLAAPKLELNSSLVRDLFEHRSRWWREAFSHDARLPTASRARSRRLLASFHRIAQGDTLIIVRQSRGVQIGRGVRQANEFRLYAEDYTIRADRLAPDIRTRAAIERLRANPRDSTAARDLADVIIRDARRSMTVQMDRQLRGDLRRSQINNWSCRVHDRTGVQVGGPGNRQYVQREVEPPRIDRGRVQRQLQQQARLYARTRDWLRETRERQGDRNRLGRGRSTR